MHRLSVTPGYFEEFGQALTDDGVAYLSDIEPGEQLRELAAGLGTRVEPGVGMPDGMHDGHSYLTQIVRAPRLEVSRCKPIQHKLVVASG